MSALLEAARQALEALEQFSDISDFTPASAVHAMTALRQAIEQAEFDAVHDALEKEAGIHISQQAEQQEPVAWIEHIAGGVEYNPYHKAALKLPEGMRFDLYTTPPQRKPLTDEAIVNMMPESIPPEYDADLIQFARAIERAHGIGGGK